MKRPQAFILLFFALFLLRGMAKAQDYPWLANNNIIVEVRGHYGFFYHHHFEMERFNAHFPAFEASVYQGTFGRKEWHYLYNYPFIGCTFYHSSLGGFEELGDAYALYPFINYPLFRDETSQFTFKLGVGVAYLTRCFDHLENPYNFSIGSHLNAAANISFEFRQEITPRLLAVASFGLTHFSNGATKSPNYGLNTFSGALGIATHLRVPRALSIFAKRPDYYKYEFDGKHWLNVDLDYGIGVKDVSQTFGKNERFLVHDFTARFLVQFTTCSRAGISLSIVKDNSDKALPKFRTEQGQLYLTDGGEYILVKDYQLIKPNISLCYSMSMDRLSFLFEIGAHLNLRSKRDGKWNTKPLLDDNNQPVMIESTPVTTLPPFSLATDFSKGSAFQRVTVQYFLVDNLYAQLSLTSHLARADYLCFGLGYRFNQKYYLNKHVKTSKLPPGLH